MGMANNEIKKNKTSVFNKIKMFFKKIFNLNYNQKLLENKEIQNDNLKYNKNLRTDFSENIKTDISAEYSKNFKLKAFMKELETNPALVENLSDDRLDQLIDFYEKITNEKAEKIIKLKATMPK